MIQDDIKRLCARFVTWVTNTKGNKFCARHGHYQVQLFSDDKAWWMCPSCKSEGK